MFQLISNDLKFSYEKYFSAASIMSLLAVLVSCYFIATEMRYGVDFSGGAEIQVRFSQDLSIDQVRGAMASDGFEGISVQSIGENPRREYLVKVAATEQVLNEVAQKLESALVKDFSSASPEILKVDIVGPRAGAELRLSGIMAMLWAMIAIMVYLGLRFDLRYAPGAVIALLHDVIIILGIFALCKIEFTLQTVAALLAVIGYSVNDTVIVYDRVREQEASGSDLPLANLISAAINQTLSRTVLTAGTTFLVCSIMVISGGGAIRDFFLAMGLGVLVGTYSSIFVAPVVTLLMAKILGKAAKDQAILNKTTIH